MNPITKVFRELSDEELRNVIMELEEDVVSGIYRTNGKFRNINDIVSSIIGNDSTTNFFMTEVNIYKEGR